MSEKLTPQALDDLQRLAEGALITKQAIDVVTQTGRIARPELFAANYDANAAFIAAANPATVLQLIAQVQAAEWQPIETAPKDGTWIMVIAATAKEPRPWFVRMEEGDWVNQRNIVVPQLFTHWQPLPPPPDRREGSE